MLWGFVAFPLRYVAYIGPLIAASAATALATADGPIGAMSQELTLAPPFGCNTWPDMYEPSSDARKTKQGAT
jgi:hypothetical protein